MAEEVRRVFEEQVTYGDENGPKPVRNMVLLPLDMYDPGVDRYTTPTDAALIATALITALVSGAPEKVVFVVCSLVPLLDMSENRRNPLNDPGIPASSVSVQDMIELAKFVLPSVGIWMEHAYANAVSGGVNTNLLFSEGITHLVINLAVKSILNPYRSVSVTILSFLRDLFNSVFAEDIVETIKHLCFIPGITYVELGQFLDQLLNPQTAFPGRALMHPFVQASTGI